MKLLLNRTAFTDHSTIGELLIDGVKNCVTLEPPFKTDGTKPRAIPCGTYPVRIARSNRFKRLIPHVLNVPGFEGVLIHVGNFHGDTEACILVGLRVDPNHPDMIDSSKVAFERLFVKLRDAKGDVSLEIRGEASPVKPTAPSLPIRALPRGVRIHRKKKGPNHYLHF